MLDPVTIITAAGFIGIFLIVFAETGLLFGFFLPGDTLLFISGIFASRGFLSLPVLIIGCAFFCIIGDSVGYFLGKKVGRKLFEREDSLFFSKKNLQHAEDFYNKHGPFTIILARFLPLIRTFAPVIAGIVHMNYKKFLIYNIVGGTIWATLVPLIGYYFGSKIPNIDDFLLPIILGIIIISFLPIIIKFVQLKIKRGKK